MPIHINFRFFFKNGLKLLFCSAYRLSLPKKAVQRAKLRTKKEYVSLKISDYLC